MVSRSVGARVVFVIRGVSRWSAIAALPELPIQYVDFAVWQRQWLQGEVLEAQVDYWKERLAGSLPVLELPTDRPRPAIRTYNGANVRFSFSKRLTDVLINLRVAGKMSRYL